MTDKLAQIEKKADRAGNWAVMIPARDVLALVEIARAAQTVLDAHGEAMNDVTPEDMANYWWPSVVDLAAAVARLQKENE